MNRNFIVAWIVVFVVWMLGDFLVHGVLLHADYAQLPNLYRTEHDSQAYLPIMLLAHVIMAGAFVWIFARGLEAKPWVAQGVRFGIAVALLAVVPVYLIYYAVQPLSGTLVVKQMVLAGILTVVLGLVVAWLYRGRAASG